MADIEEIAGTGVFKERKYVGRKSAPVSDSKEIGLRAEKDSAVKVSSQIQSELLQDPELARAVEVLPTNYNFEIHKIIHRVRTGGFKHIGLQFPEGLQLFACTIADILKKFTSADAVVLGDVTYGACCVDDYTATALSCDFLVHFGHSCLVPISECSIPVMYVFVDIGIDVDHLVRCVRLTFPPGAKLALACIIQFAAALHSVKRLLAEDYPDVMVPQSRPLSPGEVLGCTAPQLTGRDAIVFIGDGRFHLEAIMIANPTIAAYRYDPYAKALTSEQYEHDRMRALRQAAIREAATAKVFGVVLGTLGHQGSTRILEHIQSRLRAADRRAVVVLLSELAPAKLALMQQVDAWIQIACPRLSIDWGHAFAKPLLTPYEAEVALQAAEWMTPYPMDFYARDGGVWSVSGGAAAAAAKLKRTQG